MDVSELRRGGPPHEMPATYGINIDTVVTAVWTLGGKSPPILLVGCEPDFVGERTGLSAAVKGALPKAEGLVRATVVALAGQRGRSADADRRNREVVPGRRVVPVARRLIPEIERRVGRDLARCRRRPRP